MDDKSTQIPVTDSSEVPEDAVINSDGVMNDAPAPEAPLVAAPAPPQSVMDVTPPPHDPVAVESPPVLDPEEAAAMAELASEPVESSDVAPEPAPEESFSTEVDAPVSPPMETAAEDQPVPAEQTNIAPAVVTPTGGDAAVEPGAAKKSSKGLVIAVAVILALVLASAAVLYYLHTKDNKTARGITPAPTVAEKSAAAVAATSSPVSSNDVDSMSKNVDSNLGTLDANKDYSPDTLSDKSLGLQ